jgi:hypothetical protein
LAIVLSLVVGKQAPSFLEDLARTTMNVMGMIVQMEDAEDYLVLQCVKTTWTVM